MLTDDADALSVIRKIAAQRGMKVATSREYYEWRRTLDREVQLDMTREYCLALINETRPQSEHFLSDYREVSPGRWFPMKQSYRLFMEEPDDQGDYLEKSKREMNIVTLRLDEPLGDELFAYEFQEGIEVNDRRYDPAISYNYSPDMTEDDRQALLVESKKRFGQFEAEDVAREELIGQDAPAFPETTWLNSEALTWDNLKGKVVIVDFWADWCGPCRRDYPELAEMHGKRDKSGIYVIGIHTPGSKEASIQKVLDDFDMQYPICIDVKAPKGERAWGLLYSQYRVYGIPHAFVVDHNGLIAGQGSLREMKDRASELVQLQAFDK